MSRIIINDFINCIYKFYSSNTQKHLLYGKFFSSSEEEAYEGPWPLIKRIGIEYINSTFDKIIDDCGKVHFSLESGSIKF